MLKRYVIPFILLFGLLIGGMYFLLNTTWALSKLIPKVITPYLQEYGFEFKSFQFTRQSYRFPATLALEQVVLQVSKNEIDYQFDVRRVVLDEVLSWRRVREQLKMSMEGINSQGEWGKVSETTLKLLATFQKMEFVRLDGIIQGKELDVNRYHVENFYARIKGDPRQMQIFEITASAYGGNAFGQISLEKKEVLTYVLWFEFAHLLPARLQKIDPHFVRQLEGSFDGTFRLIGHPGRVELLDVNFAMPKGGVIKPELMIKVLEHMTDIEKKDRLEALLTKYDQFKVDEATFNVRSVNDTKLALFLTLVDKKNNLRVKETLNYTVSEGLQNLLFTAKK